MNQINRYIPRLPAPRRFLIHDLLGALAIAVIVIVPLVVLP